MSKELNTLEATSAIVEISVEEITKLDDLSLALVGGGQAAIQF